MEEMQFTLSRQGNESTRATRHADLPRPQAGWWARPTAYTLSLFRHHPCLTPGKKWFNSHCKIKGGPATFRVFLHAPPTRSMLISKPDPSRRWSELVDVWFILKNKLYNTYIDFTQLSFGIANSSLQLDKIVSIEYVIVRLLFVIS